MTEKKKSTQDKFGKEIKLGEMVTYCFPGNQLLTGEVSLLRDDGKVNIKTKAGKVVYGKNPSALLHEPRIPGVYSLEIYSEEARNLLLQLVEENPLLEEADKCPSPSEWLSLRNDLAGKRYAKAEDKE